MNVVIVYERSNCRSKEHSFIISMGSHEKYMMLLNCLFAPLMKINDKKSKQVKTNKYVLKGGIDHTQHLIHF